jgi:hypothetical protein
MTATGTDGLTPMSTNMTPGTTQLTDWKLEDIDDVSLRQNAKGEGVFVFQARLISGDVRHTVNLEVTLGAFKNLDLELEDKKPKDIRITFALMTELLRAMVIEWLKRSGESKWDPQARSVIRIPYFFTPTKEWPEFYLERE